MSTPEEQRFAELYRVAQAAGRSVAGSSRGYATEDDMVQEGIMWLLEHPERVERAQLPDGSLYFNRLVGETARQLARVVRRERERAGAVVPTERYAYSVRMVEIVLPGVFDPEYHPPQMIEAGMPRTQTDPAALTNWQAMVADVRRAIEQVCPVEDRRILFTRSVGGWTWAKFGSAYSHSGEWFRLRYHDALRRIAAFLSDGVLLETNPEADAVAAALADEAPAPFTDGDPDEDEWHTIGKDQYREPEY